MAMLIGVGVLAILTGFLVGWLRPEPRYPCLVGPAPARPSTPLPAGSLPTSP